MEIHVIYKLTSPSGKVYIGRTKDFDVRLIEHKYESTRDRKRPLYKAIRKYGWDNFIKEILLEVDDLETAVIKELEYITRFQSLNKKKGYNATIETNGGGDVWEGKYDTQQYKDFVEKMKFVTGGEKNAMFGKTHSEEAKKLQKEKAKGRFSLSWFIEKYGKREGKKKYKERCSALASRKVIRGDNGVFKTFSSVKPTKLPSN